MKQSTKEYLEDNGFIVQFVTKGTYDLYFERKRAKVATKVEERILAYIDEMNFSMRPKRETIVILHKRINIIEAFDSLTEFNAHEERFVETIIDYVNDVLCAEKEARLKRKNRNN